MRLKIIILSFSCILFVSASHEYREKTYVNSFDVYDALPIKWTNFMQQLDLISQRLVGGRAQVAAVFSAQRADKKFSNYFGMYNPARNQVENFVGIDQADTGELLASMDIIHDYARASSLYAGYGMRDRVSFSPERQTYTYIFDYVHGFDSVKEGIAVHVRMPIMKVKTWLNPRSIISDARGMNLPGGGTHVTLMDYLSGGASNTDARNAQTPLGFLKISSDVQEKQGICGVEPGLRVRFWSDEASHFDLGVRAIIPYGPVGTGEFLYEPVILSGRNYGIGFELMADILAFESNDLSVELVMNSDFKYLLPANQVRVPLFKNAQGEVLAFGPYQLGAAVGSAGLFPLANVLAREFKIYPGQALQASFSCIFSRQGLSMECGSSVRAKSAEKVEIIDWEDDKYGVAKWDYNATTNATTSSLWSTVGLDDTGIALNAPANKRTINKENLDLDSIKSPGMMQGGLYAFIGYAHQKRQYPFTFGIGMMYEFPIGSNALAGSLSCWGKAGINF